GAVGSAPSDCALATRTPPSATSTTRRAASAHLQQTLPRAPRLSTISACRSMERWRASVNPFANTPAGVPVSALDADGAGRAVAHRLLDALPELLGRLLLQDV